MLDTKKDSGFVMEYVFITYGTAISWKINLHKVVVFSTTKAEYIAMTEFVKEALRLKGLAKKLNVHTRLSLSTKTLVLRYNFLGTKSTMKELSTLMLSYIP